MMKETGTNSKKFIWRQRIGFGISDYACNLAYLMVNTYLLIFYTDVAGIPAASAAFMFLITKFIDAFTDSMAWESIKSIFEKLLEHYNDR